MFKKILLIALITVAWAGLAGCSRGGATAPTATPPPLADELIFYDWEEDMPEPVLEAFTQEFGVKVNYVTYETQEEAIANIRDGQVYDVVVLDNDFLPQIIHDGLLAEIDYSNVPNFKNISANFRDLAYDPGNKHSIPFNWGTTGLVIRDDLVQINRWADLWNPDLPGKIGLRDEPREPMAVAQKALGLSINTEEPQEVEAAFNHLLKLRPNTVIVDSYAEAVVPLLDSGEVVVLLGWAEDVIEGREVNEHITYVLPQEGPMLWGDNYVIPANSPRKYTAEVFLNFLLRPEISAMIVNQNYYASANETAREFIEPEIRNDPVIFPPDEDLKKGEVYLPLSPAGEATYQELWDRFKAAGQ